MAGSVLQSFAPLKRPSVSGAWNRRRWKGSRPKKIMLPLGACAAPVCLGLGSDFYGRPGFRPYQKAFCLA